METTSNALAIAGIINRKLHPETALTTQEERMLATWLDESENNREFYRRLEAGLPLGEFDAVTGQFDLPALWERIEASTATAKPAKRPLRWVRYAAGIVAAVSITAYLWISFRPQEETLICSGTPLVELILADGQKVTVDRSSDKVHLGAQGRALVNDTTTSTLYYESGTSRPAAEPVYNTLIVPRAGQYSMVLPDGSRVWLNSNSSLRFPDRFADDSREVYLEGEAYFDVVKDAKKPFRVYIDTYAVTVLGTSFNVTAYPADRYLTTSLVEGSVRIDYNDTRTTLTPGRQCMLDRHTDTIHIFDADTERLTAWVDGKFYFVGYTVAQIVSKMALWYDFEMVYDDAAIAGMRFSGTINKNRPLNELLHFMEQTETLRFKIEGRTVTAYKN